MRRNVCRGCGSSDLECFLDLGDMPLAGGFLPNSKEAISREKKFKLDIFFCNECSLVQILEIVDPDIMFQDYSFSSSTVHPLVKHFTEYANWIDEIYAPKKVLEFGCNDGILLRPLVNRGVEAVGVDPSGNISEMGRKFGSEIVTGYFGNQDLSNKIIETYGKFDLVTGSNVFAHNDDPHSILNAAKQVLNDDGVLCLEVMYAGDLLEQFQWDTLYHEHLTFYSLTSIKKLFNKNGFEIINAVRLPMHGGSLRIAASKSDKHKIDSSVNEILEHELKLGLGKLDTWRAFGTKAIHKIDVVKNVLGELSKTKKIWAYGAAGKSTLWVNACEMGYLQGVVDASPLRYGKLMPGTHTPIVSPDEFKKSQPDIVFVTAWNYAENIKNNEPSYNGIWATPLPNLSFY